MTTDGWAAAFNLGLALREAFLETYGDESIGRSAKPGVKKGLGKRFARRFARSCGLRHSRSGVVIAIRTFNGHDLFSCVAGAAGATGELIRNPSLSHMHVRKLIRIVPG